MNIDFNYKKQKIEIHSLEDINNAVFAVSDGYMTRNKLKKQLKNNCSESIESRNNNSKNIKSKIISVKDKRNRSSKSSTSKNKLQLAYVFTQDIFSTDFDKNLVVQHKNRTPSLFESDSEPEIDYFQVDAGAKNEGKEKLCDAPELKCTYSASNKNNEVKTYFNKKSCSTNNKYNISSNSFEKIHQSTSPSSLFNQLKTLNGTIICKTMNNGFKHLDKIRAQEVSSGINSAKSFVFNSEQCKDDEVISCNSGILNYKNETTNTLPNIFDVAKEKIPVESGTSIKHTNINEGSNSYLDFEMLENFLEKTIEPNNFQINEFDNSFPENHKNTCIMDTETDDMTCNKKLILSSCNNSLLKQDTNDKKIVINKQCINNKTLLKPTNIDNNGLSIFDLPKENTLLKHNISITKQLISSCDTEICTNISEEYELDNLQIKTNCNNSLSNHIIDTNELELIEPNTLKRTDNVADNHLMAKKKFNEENDSCSILRNKMISNLISVQYIYTANTYEKNKNDNSVVIENDNSNLKINNFLNNSQNIQIGSKCGCKIFYSFNKDANKILTSKVNHFVFNVNAKQIREKLVHLKHLEANILKSLMINDVKRIQSEIVLPIFKSIPINIKHEKCINIEENDHIEPRILNMLKDVYVGVDYLSECCDFNKDDDKLYKQQNFNTNIKDNFYAKKEKTINNIYMVENDNNVNVTNNHQVYTMIDNNVNDNQNTIDNLHYDNQTLEINKSPYLNKETIIKDPSVGVHELLMNKNEKFELNNENKFNALLNVQTNYELIPSLEKINSKCIDSFDETSENRIETNFAVQNTTIKYNNSDIKNIDKTCNKVNSKFDAKNEIKLEDNYNYCNMEVEMKPFNLYQSMKTDVLVNEDSCLNMNSMPLCLFEEPSKSLFNLTDCDIRKSYYSSSDNDDDNKLKIDWTSSIELIEDNTSINPLNKLPDVINVSKDHNVSKSNLLENKISLSIDKHNNLYESEENNQPLANCMFMTIEMCNDYYENKLMNKNINHENKYFPKYINDIFTEMYVDKSYIPICHHMVDLCDNTNVNMTSKEMDCNIKTENVINFKNKTEHLNFLQKPNDTNQPCSILKQFPPINPKIMFKTNIMDSKPSKSARNVQMCNSPKKRNSTNSNIKIRIQLREFIISNQPINEIIESKEFKNLTFFNEEEIANSIGVLIFEQTIETPIITGLSVYKESYDHLIDEEKNKILRSTNLSITCPKIMKLTIITLALMQMLRSDSLINHILNVIRKNVFNKHMNTDNSTDHHLIKYTAYYVTICIKLSKLKTLQTFIFDSMVLIPNKYCCVIFISLLLWKNCLPIRVNNEQDPVIITAISHLISKKKFYSEQTASCDIYQQELINLLSVYFNYSFTLDFPSNFIQHKHKNDFFIAVIMFLKCSHPKDLIELMDTCIFPIIEYYLNNQHNDTNAIKIMELINLTIRPFKVSCNTTVTTYLSKCKTLIDNTKKNKTEHIYHSIYNSYRHLQKKLIGYLNDNRIYSQSFEEILVSIIMVLGSADYITSCVALIKWKPSFQPSIILSKKFNMFKSILGNNIWEQLCTLDDIHTIKSMINSSLLKKNEYKTFEQLYALR